jgi:hypothetical protein
VVGVDELGVTGGHVRQHAKPTARKDLVVDSKAPLRDAGTRNAVKPVTTRDEVAAQLVRGVAHAETHGRPIRVEVVYAHLRRLVDRRATRSRSRGHQITSHLSLAKDGHAPTGQRSKVDPMQLLIERELDAVVHEAFGVQASRGVHPVEQRHRRLFEDTRANAPEHMFRSALLDEHIVDSGQVQQLPEQQPGRAGSDDGDLGALRCHEKNARPPWSIS